jgi:hypothetical protein
MRNSEFNSAFCNLDPKLFLPPDPVPGKEITSQDEEKERSLKHQTNRRGQMHHRLELIPAHQQTSQKDGHKDKTRRMELR